MLKKIVFEDAEYEYDPKVAVSYVTMKRVARAAKDPAAFFDVAEAIFAGRDEEYAVMLGDSTEKVGELIAAIISNEGGSAKN